MATAKTAALSLRISPSVKEALRVLAEKEHRNIAAMIEMMIRDYGKRNGRSYDWSPCQRKRKVVPLFCYNPHSR